MARSFQWCILIGIIFFSSMAQAATMVPFRFGGSVNYNYGYYKSENAESNRQSIYVVLNADGYIWRPWLITIGGGLQIGFTKDESSASNSGSTANVYTGNLGFRVFPQSRFPFSLSAVVSDSRLENNNIVVGVTEYQNFNLALTQSYFARNGAFVFFSWNHNEFESDINNYDSDAFNVSYRQQKNRQSLYVTGAYNVSESDSSALKPKLMSLSLNHSYLPTGTSNVNSFLSHNINDPDKDTVNNESSISQASSVFTWRPTHKPLTFNGAALVNRTENQRPSGDPTESIGLSTQFGANYQFSRRLRLYSSLGMGLTDRTEATTTQANGSVSLNYSSEQYLLGGFNYNFGVGFGVAANYTSQESKITDSNDTVSEETTDSVSGNANFGQGFSRNWIVGRASSVNFGFAQSISGGSSSEADEPSYTLGHSLSSGWSTRHLRGSTYGSLTLSDSRSFSDIETEFQQLQADLNHSRSLSRVSALLASLSLGWSRQAQDLGGLEDNQLPAETDSSFESSDSTNYLRLLGSYRNSRLFGVYPFRLLTRLRYTASNLDDKEEGFDKSTVDWDAKFSYNIGLLTTSLTLDATYNFVGASNFGVNFQIGRVF